MPSPGSVKLFHRLRPLLLPLSVTGIGIAISLGMFLSFKETYSSGQLAVAGRELVRVSDDLQSIALGQVLAVQGLYESSSGVTEIEFDHFADVIGNSSGNQLAYARMVPANELDFFVERTRRSHPDFTVSVGLEPSDVYWPLLYSSLFDGAGYKAGFDFGSDPIIGQVIETAFGQDRPIVSSIVAVPGDDTAGDFAIVAPIRHNGARLGIAVVTLQLDELLADRVQQLLGGTAHLSMSDLVDVDEPAFGTETRWEDTVEVVGHDVRLVLEVTDGLAPPNPARWLLVLGVAASLLAGGLIHVGSRRLSMTRQVAALQETLAGKDRFLASVSHELRTPLTAVVGLAEILASRSGDFGVENRELIQDVRSSAQELETLVEDHLTSARLTAGALTVKKDRVDLDVLVARAIAITDLPQRLSIQVAGLGACIGDAIRVRQIVRNLLHNACRYATSTIEIRSNNTTDLTVMEVLNDGGPVSEDVVGSMFEPFVKGKRPGQPETIGLGLSVSRKLAQRMGGDLIYIYQDGKATFRLSLPAPIRSEAARVREILEPIAS
jgi:signal transduction histidine kinase